MSTTELPTLIRPNRRRRMADVAQHAINTWGRVIFCGIGALLQATIVLAGFSFLSSYSGFMMLVSALLGTIVTIVILNSHMPMVYKLAWVIPVLLLPLAGSFFYLLYGARKIPRRTMHSWEKSQAKAVLAMDLVPGTQVSTKHSAHTEIQRLESTAQSPLRNRCDTTYFSSGESGFAAILEAISAAQRYIFIETFIVADGTMFETLFELLKHKSDQGVQVRFMYDDLGSALTVPPHLKRRCRKAGIALRRVNPFDGRFNLRMNHRDHRKLIVIDGVIAFTGGMNIGDEYINEKQRFGRWKDSLVRMEGTAAWSFTVFFLQLWEITTRESVSYPEYLPQTIPSFGTDGLVLPFAENPFLPELVAEPAYRNQIIRAQESIDIFTPYLILNDSIQQALCEAAVAGIRVRIVTPKRPDKWYVHSVTRSFYPALLKKGVQIYEYTPGFIHAKSILIDRKTAICGTINFDYRSFYLHQECAVWMHETKAVEQLAQDVEDTIAQCHKVTVAEMSGMGWVKHTISALLRTFAPLM